MYMSVTMQVMFIEFTNDQNICSSVRMINMIKEKAVLEAGSPCWNAPGRESVYV